MGSNMAIDQSPEKRKTAGDMVGGKKTPPVRNKTPAAERALAEAAARRAQAEVQGAQASLKASRRQEKEINGPKGPEPTRYGDWERKGIVSDF